MVETYFLRPAIVLAALFTGSHAKDIYVSPTGSGDGTSTSPYGSVQSAVDDAAAGDTILLRAGTYSPTTNIQITKSGTATAPITLRSYEKEKVIFDGESLPGYVLLLVVFLSHNLTNITRTPYGLDESLPNNERGILHIENGNYWKFYNLE